MKLKVGRVASEDLEAIWLYTVEHWSLEQADKYTDLILDAFDRIRIDPSVGKDFQHVRLGYLGLNVGSHTIFYRLNQAEHAVEIIRVLHGRMDLENRLSS